MRQKLLLRATFTEVGEGRAGVGTDAWNLVVDSLKHCMDDLVSKLLLEFLGHVIRELADAVHRGVSNLGILVLQVLNHDTDHRCNSVYVLDVFANLTEGHQSRILVSPVGVVLKQLLHKYTEVREADLVANSSHYVVDARLAKVEVVSFHRLIRRLLFIALLWSEPVLLNVLVDVNHELEDQLEELFEQIGVLLHNRWNTLDDHDEELERLVSNELIGVVLVHGDWLQGMEQVSKLSLEELRLEFRNLIELSQSLVEHDLVVILVGIQNHLNHGGNQFFVRLRVLPLSHAEVGGDRLQGRELNVKIGVGKFALEDSEQLLLLAIELVDHDGKEAREAAEAAFDVLCIV